MNLSLEMASKIGTTLKRNNYPYKQQFFEDSVNKLKFIFIYLVITKKAVIDMSSVYITPYIYFRDESGCSVNLFIFWKKS